MSLAAFSQKLKVYLKASGYSQKILANALGWNPSALTHKLNGTGRTIFTHPEIKACIIELVKLEAVTRQGEVLDLLNCARCPNFKREEWKSSPLNLLLSDLPHSSPWLVDVPSPSILDGLKDVSHNIPAPISSFIGRQQDLINLKKLLLEDKRRLVTLVGAGGIGKTRLALFLGKELVNYFADGVWQVELAPINNPALIPQAISEVLGLLEQPGQSILENLSHNLRQRHLLLILDNCEHLVEECSRITHHLLTHSTHLQILTTSRENLDITGEATYRVPSLSLPTAEKEESLPIEKTIIVEEYEAIKLFVERARTTNVNFIVEPDEVASLTQICLRLDGIPLAIELAAARTTILSLGQIEARLNDCFQLLTGGSRTSLPRHQTLRALVDWSYNLLSEAEKRLLVSASIFVGSWDLEVAEQVCGSGAGSGLRLGVGLEKYEVLDCLNNLVNKSLLLMDKQSEGQAVRFHILETIRQYGLEKLQDEEGAEEAIRQRHFNYYVDLLKETGSQLFEGEQLLMMKQLDREIDNIRAALDYGLKRRQTDQLMQTIKGMGVYWEIRGYYSEGRHYLEQVLALPQARDKKNEQGLGWTLSWAGRISMHQWDLDAMKPFITQALAVSEAYGEDKELNAFSFRELMNIHLVDGNFIEAQRKAEELVILTQGVSNFFVAAAMLSLGYVLLVRGEYAEAEDRLEKALTIIRKEKNLLALTNCLISLGCVALLRENYPAAQGYLEEALSTSEMLGYRPGNSDALSYLGLAYSFQDKFNAGRQVLLESLNLFVKGGGRTETWAGFGGVVGLLNRVWAKREKLELVEQIAFLCGIISWIIPEGNNWEIPKRWYEQGIEIAQAGLSEIEYKEAFGRGQKLSQQEIIAFIRQVLSQI